MSRFKPFISLLLFFALTACAVPRVHDTVPNEKYEDANVQGFSENIRFWADVTDADLTKEIAQRVQEYATTHKGIYERTGKLPDMHYLAISGGGHDGAYAAGLVNGWSDSGKRPEFAIVSGISAGALIAPFVFLGPQYDILIKELHTEIEPDNIFKAGVFTVFNAVTGGTALTDSSPLAENIQKYITPQVFQAIANEHNKGRRLFIGTTNLEAQRGVIWNIGEIANIGTPKALNLFHNILLASSAIPGVFEPVLLDVEINGKAYQELHVDGGVTSQVFIYPAQFSSDIVPLFIEAGINRNLYIIRNGKLNPDFKKTQASFFDITKQSIDTLIKYQGLGDLYKLYLISERDKLSFNLSFMQDSFLEQPKEDFDPTYMNALYQHGYDSAINGIEWIKRPPGLDYID